MDSKPFWQSRTLWGAIITFLTAMLATFGFEIPGGAEQLTDAVLTIVGALGVILTAIGRFGATKSLNR